ERALHLRAHTRSERLTAAACCVDPLLHAARELCALRLRHPQEVRDRLVPGQPLQGDQPVLRSPGDDLWVAPVGGVRRDMIEVVCAHASSPANSPAMTTVPSFWYSRRIAWIRCSMVTTRLSAAARYDAASAMLRMCPPASSNRSASDARSSASL